MADFGAATAFFRRCLGDDWEDRPPVELSGTAVQELLWPFNDVYRPRREEVEDLEYEPRFEAAADGALDDMAATLDIGLLGRGPAGVVRVLLERHTQMLVVATAAADAPVTYLPSGLSREEQRIGAALLLLRGMKLPWPPGGPQLSGAH